MQAIRTLNTRLTDRLTKGALVLAAFAAFGSSLGAQTIPIAVVSRSQTIVSTINNNAGHVGANTAGDSFYVSQGDSIAYWVPRGTTKPIALVTGLSGSRSVYVDQKNNVYVPNNYSGTIIEIPYVNGSYATGTAASATAACTTSTPTSPCTQFGSGGATTSYYYQPTDLGFDASGNAYVIDEYSNPGSAGPGKSNSILRWSLVNGSYAATYIVQNLPQNNSAQIAVSPNGDVYYADGTNLYMVSAGSTSATMLTNNATTNPTGVATDKYGNVFITNASTPYAILELPAVNGKAVPSKQFTFSQAYSANGIAFDGLGDYFSTAYSGGTTLVQTQLYAFNLGSAAIGKPSSAAAITLNLLFTGNATPATIALAATSNGFAYVPGSCAAGTTYNAGSSCNINVTYTPTAAGLQRGAIVLADNNGANIATLSLSGIGLASELTSDAGTVTSVGSSLKTPQAVAVDSANNVYIADPAQNAVLRYVAGATTSTSVGTGLNAPTSVAVDGAGNVYIADAGNGRVVEVPAGATAPNNAGQVVIASGFGNSLGIAVDLNTNLYIADAAHAKVYQLANVDGLPNAGEQSQVIVTGLAAPIAVATDPTGNLFIADTTANTITEIAYYGKGQLNIGSGYSHPSGIAADAAGSIYIADAGNSRLLKVPYEAPIFNTNDQYAVNGTVLAPYGVALDASANIYIVDSSNAAAYFLNRAQGTLPLGRANLNTPTSTLNGYVGNSGNLPFTLGTPDYVATGNTTAFTVASPSGKGCANGAVIGAGFSCILNASFDPTSVGNFSDTLAFTSNATFPANPSLTLTGLGLNLAATTLTLAQTSPTGTASFGQVVTVTATIASTKSGTPTGSVMFYVDGGSPVTVAVNGVNVAVQLKGLTGGTHSIAASYTGDNNFAPSNTTLTITVAQTGSSTVVSVNGSGVYQNPPSAQPGTPLTFTAVVTPSASVIPTGTVTFTSGSIVLGKATVTPSGTTYVAIATSGALPAGASTVTATYSGDVNYASSAGTLAVILSPITYTLTPANSALTVATVDSKSVGLQLNSIAGFTGFVGLVCSGLPANTVCGFSPNSAILQPSNLISNQRTDINGIVLVPATYGPTNVAVTFDTGVTPPVLPPTIHAFNLPGTQTRIPYSWAVLGFVPLGLLLARRKNVKIRRSLRLFSVLLLLAGTSLTFSGCGSGLFGNTPKGTYQVTVTATSVAQGYTGALAPGCALSASASTAATPTCTQTATITLTVQ